MDKQKNKSIRRGRRRTGLRKRLEGGPDRPRLAVYRSLNHIYAQVIDDMAGKTLCAASTREKVDGVTEKTGNASAAAAVGKAIAARALALGIRQVAFDRGGFRYHGRVKALADSARGAGLSF
ncbi:MAG TPA: 50S ribosomal protein L18 [Phycisphaerales bacterium]|nr:50S ribosomal protein L18 [Phycisphaerales bacterium]